MGNDVSMRRLFLVEFSCPLCGQKHSGEIYLTLVARAEDEMMEKAVQTLNRDDVKVKTLAPLSRVNYSCRFTSSAWPRCWAALVRKLGTSNSRMTE